MTVILDGSKPESGSPAPRPSRRLALAVGAVGALAAIGLVGASAFEGVNDRSTGAGGSPLGELVEGLDRTVLLLVQRDGQSYHQRWPAHRSLAIEDRLPIDTATFNASGELVAGVGSGVPDLYVGTADDITVVAPDVTSVVWHQTDPNKLAATRLLGTDAQVWLGELTETNGLRFTSLVTVPNVVAVAAYGEWGVAVETPSPAGGVFFVQLFDPEGNEIDQRSGRVVGSWEGEDGGVVIDSGNGELEAMSPIDSAELEIPDGDIRSIAWVSDGGRAVIGLIVDGEPVVEVWEAGAKLGAARGDLLGWTTDGRFAMVETTDGIGFLDVVDGSFDTVEIEGTIVDAVTSPG